MYEAFSSYFCFIVFRNKKGKVVEFFIVFYRFLSIRMITNPMTTIATIMIMVPGRM